jgi:hypothetical protein
MKGLQSVAVFAIGAALFCQQHNSPQSHFPAPPAAITATVTGASYSSKGGDTAAVLLVSGSSGTSSSSTTASSSSSSGHTRSSEARSHAASHKLQCYTDTKAMSMVVVVAGLFLYACATSSSSYGTTAASRPTPSNRTLKKQIDFRSKADNNGTVLKI